MLKVLHVDNPNFHLCQFSTRNTTNTHDVTARREIVLAAGAIHSPQILQLSGIGPGRLLSDLGIEVKVDLPGVGYNFQDQPTMFLSFNCEFDWFNV